MGVALAPARRLASLHSMRATILIAAVALATCSTLATPPAPARSSGRACGLVGRVGGRLYDVRETRGTLSCRVVRSVMRRFLVSGATLPGHGWVCFRGHGSAPYAASCARGRRILVRAYAPT